MVNWVTCQWLCIDPDFFHKYTHLLRSEDYFKKLKIEGLENETLFVKHTKFCSWIDKKQYGIAKKHFLDAQNNQEYIKWLTNTVLNKTNNLSKISETIAQKFNFPPNQSSERLTDLLRLYRHAFGELLNYSIVKYFANILVTKLRNEIKTDSVNLNALIYPIKTSNLKVYHNILTLSLGGIDKNVITTKYNWYPQVYKIVDMDKNKMIKHKNLLKKNWKNNEEEFKKNYAKVQNDVGYDSIKIIQAITNWFDYFDLIERRTHFNMQPLFLTLYKKLQLSKFAHELECLNYLRGQELEKALAGKLNSADISRLIIQRKKGFKIMRCKKGYFFE